MRFMRRSNRASSLGDNDPLTGVANLFDLGLVFVVGLLLALLSAYHLEELLDRDSSLTIMKQDRNGTLTIVTKKARKIQAVRVSRRKARGRGELLGTAYRLEDGSMVYVPEENSPMRKGKKP